MTEKRTVWLIELVSDVTGASIRLLDITDTYEQALLIVKHNITSMDGYVSTPYQEAKTGYWRVDDKSMDIYYLLKPYEMNRLLQGAIEYYEYFRNGGVDSDE